MRSNSRDHKRLGRVIRMFSLCFIIAFCPPPPPSARSLVGCDRIASIYVEISRNPTDDENTRRLSFDLNPLHVYRGQVPVDFLALLEALQTRLYSRSK
jgi:hypothetical protein